MGMVACFAPVSADDLRRLYSDPSAIDAYLDADEDGEQPLGTMDVDKAWHAIHYMLCGSPDEVDTPEGQAVLGGSPIGEDLGYGPARVLSPSEVAAIANVLEPLTPESFAERYDPLRMDRENIYPEIWERDGDEALHYVIEFYAPLRRLYLGARDRGDGVLLWIS